MRWLGLGQWRSRVSGRCSWPTFTLLSASFGDPPSSTRWRLLGSLVFSCMAFPLSIPPILTKPGSGQKSFPLSDLISLSRIFCFPRPTCSLGLLSLLFPSAPPLLKPIPRSPSLFSVASFTPSIPPFLYIPSYHRQLLAITLFGLLVTQSTTLTSILFAAITPPHDTYLARAPSVPLTFSFARIRVLPYKCTSFLFRLFP